MNDTINIDGFGPLPVRTPTNAAELGTLVRESQAIYPVGGGMHLHIGLPPTKPGIAVSMKAFDHVIDHAARDMTITLQAGLTFAKLAEVLAKENQWLPVDIANPERATVGGVLATNLSGPRRLGQGTLRDYLLGISFVTDEGVEVKGGGRVVKNVAGYDLMKLQIGALGTLGIITQVTFKVKPRPETSALVAFGMNAATVGPTLERLHASASRPIAIELLNSVTARIVGLKIEEPWVIVCGFEEKRVTVNWQIETLMSDLKAAPVRGTHIFRDAEAVPIWNALTLLGYGNDEEVLLKVNTLPSQSAAISAAMAATHSEAIIHAHAGSGILFGHFPVENIEKASQTVTELLKSLTSANANLTVVRCPTAWKSRMPVWGRETADRTTMRNVMKALDPLGRFNPGRFII